MMLLHATSAPRTKNLTKISIVVPCFNEEQGIDQLADRLESLRSSFADRMLIDVVFVDDGSTDQTVNCLERRFGETDWARVIRHQVNRGITAAILTGIKNSTNEFVVSIDADCTYDPIQVIGLLDMMRDDVAMVTASPYHPQGMVEGVPKWRLGLSRIASRCYEMLLGTKLHTYTSCFRLHRRSMVETLEIRESGFVGVAEMLWQVQKHGGKIVETPARLTSRRVGFSKMRTVPVIFSHLKLMTRIFVDGVFAPKSKKSK